MITLGGQRCSHHPTRVPLAVRDGASRTQERRRRQSYPGTLAHLDCHGTPSWSQTVGQYTQVAPQTYRLRYAARRPPSFEAEFSLPQGCRRRSICYAIPSRPTRKCGQVAEGQTSCRRGSPPLVPCGCKPTPLRVFREEKEIAPSRLAEFRHVAAHR